MQQLCWRQGFFSRKTQVLRVGVENDAESLVSISSSSFSSSLSPSFSSSSSSLLILHCKKWRTSTSERLAFHLQLTPRENAGFLNLSRHSHGEGSLSFASSSHPFWRLTPLTAPSPSPDSSISRASSSSSLHSHPFRKSCPPSHPASHLAASSCSPTSASLYSPRTTRSTRLSIASLYLA